MQKYWWDDVIQQCGPLLPLLEVCVSLHPFYGGLAGKAAMEKPRGVPHNLPLFVHCSPSSQVYSFTLPQGSEIACFLLPESEKYSLPQVVTAAEMQGATQAGSS